MKRIYRIDHFYFYNNNKYCLLLESELEPDILAKIIVAIQFKYEELVSESGNVEFEDLIKILKKFYNVKDVKEEYKYLLKETDTFDKKYCIDYSYIYKFDLKEIEVIKIDVYLARESHCTRKFRYIYNHLVSKEIEKMICEIK